MEEADVTVEAHGAEEYAGEQAAAAHHHGPPHGFIRKYIFSIDHKVIGIQYLLLALFSVFMGMGMSVLMRLNMTWPGHAWPLLGKLFPTGAPNGVMSPEFYLSLVTRHGAMTVVLRGTTGPQGGF